MALMLDRTKCRVDAIISTSSHAYTTTKPFLDMLITMGFSSVRYYDVVYNVPAEDELLVLSEYCGMEEKNGLIGFQIDYKDSTLSKTSNYRKPVVDCGYLNHSLKEKEWIQFLGQEDKCWIDIPLYIEKDLLGLIACDWVGTPNDLSSDDIAYLQLISSVVAAKLYLAPSRIIEKNRCEIESLRHGSTAAIDFLRAITKEICINLDIAVLAVFEHHWETGKLKKIIEHINPKIALHASDFDETFMVGEYLTGDAWDQPRYRHIVDFNRLSETKNFKDLIWRPSFDRHNTLLKKITSILYEKIGGSESRFMLRLMNRTDDLRLPLMASHKSLIIKICQDISVVIEDMIHQQRLKLLQDTTKEILEKIEPSSEKSIRVINNCLFEEGINNFAFLCHTEGSSYLSLNYCHIDGISDVVEPKNTTWDTDTFYSKVVGIDEPTLQEIKKFPENKNNQHLLGKLTNSGFKTLLIFPIRAPRTKGIIVCPLLPYGHHSGKLSIASFKHKFPDKFKTLNTYAAILGSYIEACESYLTTEGARRLIGYIGHEVSTPIATLGQKTTEALLLTLREIPEDNKELRQKLIEREKYIEEEVRHVGKTMDVAQMVAQENIGWLQLHFCKSNLYNILKKTVEAMHDDIWSFERRKKYEIVFNPACRKIGSIICDPELLQQVFINLFRNALKYSLPRYPDEHKKSMIIDVLGQPQTNMTIIQVKNWGFGIATDDFENIFKPFVRGGIHDRIKAIRGMGLGLYVARRIVTAHKGYIFCKESTFTLDDPKKRELMQGFETVFEVRLPHVLKEGTIDDALRIPL